MDYKIHPGLYAFGNPDRQSPVLVTANYKMSFDRLREAISERSAWLLVLNTEGINVWCAAGKETFGTTELVRRIALTGLDKIVDHRRLVLPQLARSLRARVWPPIRLKCCPGSRFIMGDQGYGLACLSGCRFSSHTANANQILFTSGTSGPDTD